jgi:hypothetical protein
MESNQDFAEMDARIIHPNAGRRRVLGLIGAGIAGMAMVPVESMAAAAPTGLTPTQLAAWNRFMAEYAAYLAKQRFRYISVRRIIEAHMKCHGPVRNTPPPRSMWKNIVPTLRVADRVAYELRAPLDEVVSVYRSPRYNATCPGAKRESMHTKNLAVDIKFKASPSSVAAVAEKLRKKGYFRGGIGRYSGFTHIDTRGENVDWHG